MERETDPTEQTVTEAVYERFPYSMPLPCETIAVLGIDPDMPASRLAADLAIAARARACRPCTALSKDAATSVHATDHWDDGCYFTASGLLAYLLNGEQP